MRASDSTIVGRRRKTVFTALVALLAITVAGSASADPLPYTGTLEFRIADIPELDEFGIPGSGTASVSLIGDDHIASLALAAGAFGPLTTSLPVTSSGTLNSVIFTSLGNLSGSFPAISGGPPGGGTMGLSGTAKICLVFAPCAYSGVPFPLAPTTGGAGFGIGGTVTVPGPVAITMQHSPWTLGQPAMTIHTPNSNVTSPDLPGGFAHGPASVTSSTAAGFGELQMVTVTKAYTSLTTAIPELPLFARLHLAVDRDVCDDGADNDGDGLIDYPADPGCDDAEDGSELSSALVCDNGLDDDGDSLVDFEDPGCDDPTDPSEKAAVIACDDAEDGSEQSPSLVCDNGLDDDADSLVDVAEDPG